MGIIYVVLYTMALGVPAMLLHESAHVVVAVLCGVKVKKVGVSRMGLYTVRDPGPRWANLIISLAGPGMNLFLGIVLNNIFPAFAFVNLIAAAYNLLPIPNSDGLRILKLFKDSTPISTSSVTD